MKWHTSKVVNSRYNSSKKKEDRGPCRTWTGEWQVISGDRYDVARIEAVYFALAGGGAYAPWAPMPFDLGLLPEGPMGFLGGGGGTTTMLSRALRAATDPTRQPSNVETALHAHAHALRQHRLRHAPPAPGGLERRVQQHYQYADRGFDEEYSHHMQVQAFARTHPRVYAGREEFVFDSVARPRTAGGAAGPDILHRIGGGREQDPERDPDPFYTDPTDWDPTGGGDNNWRAFAFAGQVYPREVQRGRLSAMAADSGAGVPLPLRKAFSQDSSRVDHERIARIPRAESPAVVRFLSRKELPLDLVSSVEAGVPAEEKNSFVYEIVEIP
eukprot:g8374.t1